MIQKVECVCIACDNCGEIFQSYHNDFSIFVDEGNANDTIQNDDHWYAMKEIHYCPDCHTINDEDELVINESRTKPNQTS